MPRFLVLPALFLFSTFLMGQAPYRSPSELAKESTKIVVGVVLGKKLWVIQPEKVAPRRNEVQPDGTVVTPIQFPGEYIVGQIVRVRMDEVIKEDETPNVGNVVIVFTPGFFPTEGMAALIQGQRYVLFLSPLKSEGKRFSGTVIKDPSDSLAEKKNFDPASVYSIVGGTFGAVLLKADNTRVLNKIKAAVASSQ